jgi:tetratricopeptide (TPR) repeat protein
MKACPACGTSVPQDAEQCPGCGADIDGILDGKLIEAEPLAKEAVRLALQTDQLESQAEAHAGLAEVLRLAERREEAANELNKALALHEEKGSRLMAKRVRRELISLRR